MRRGRIWRTCLVLAWMLPALSGCGLLPAEKQVARIPLVKEYTSPDYSQVYVQRGPFSITTTVSCRYIPVKDATYGFGVSGVYYDAVYVQQGDKVHAGDLLATLDMGDLPQQIQNARNTLAELELSRTHLLEQQALAVRQQQTLLGGSNAQEREGVETVQQVRERYDRYVEDTQQAIFLQQLRMDALEQERAQREIRAGMDGTVAYARRVREGERSVEGTSIIRIADMTHSVFMASTESWALFEPGDIVTIKSSRVDYEALVTTPEALGLSVQVDPEAKKRNVYFSLLEPAPELEDGDSGTTVLILEHREDTLFVEKKAVHTFGDMRVVYYQDPQTGIRNFKQVETGLESGRYVEILSGLSEGESIILK